MKAGLWRKVCAIFRFRLDAVCEESAAMGDFDMHDWVDAKSRSVGRGYPMWCKRCNKRFRM